MKKCLSAALCMVLLVCVIAGCGQKGIVKEFASGWIGLDLSAEQCKEQINNRIKSDANKIGDLKATEDEGEKALANMEKTVEYTYTGEQEGNFFFMMADGGEDKILTISNFLYTDEATQEAEELWKERNRAILRTTLPQLSKKKCENLLNVLGETDSASRSEDYKKEKVVDGVRIKLEFYAAEPDKSYSKNLIEFSVFPVQPTQK